MRYAVIKPDVAAKLPAALSVATLLMRELGTKWLDFYQALPAHERFLLQYDWSFWARPEQMMPPGPWRTWVIMAGRGFGKTRPGSETVNRWADELGRRYGGGHIGLIGKDPEDIRKVMIEQNESSILKVSPPWFMPNFEPSKKRLTWPNGVVASYYSSEEPDQLRGPQHHKIWGDEICKWRKPKETWDMAAFGLRLGDDPQAILTTTPRPIEVLYEILKDPSTVVTRGSTEDNEQNLPDAFLSHIYRKYKGTRLGRQELAGELLKDTPGALWTLTQIDALRIPEIKPDDCDGLVVAVDPAVTDPHHDPEIMEQVAETGIIVVGRRRSDGHGIVLGDYSGHFGVHEWGTSAASHYQTYKADSIVGEVNNGGDMVEYVIRTEAKHLGYEIAFKKVHASRGKRTRAEPVAALYQQKRFHHAGEFPELEDQMSTWTPGQKSPDRMDALVWGATEVMVLANDEFWCG